MLILAKLFPLVVYEFDCVIFQTLDVLMLGKLSVKLEAENRLTVHHLQDSYIQDR